MDADQPPPPRVQVVGDIQGEQRRIAGPFQAHLNPPDLVVHQPRAAAELEAALGAGDRDDPALTDTASK